MTATDEPKPIRVDYGKTVHGEEEIAAVVRVLRTSTQMGDNVREFEHRVAALFAKRFGVMVNSGSSALALAMEALDLPEGSQVITPVLTFATTVVAVLKNGLIPAFVDVNAATYNIDVSRIEEMIDERTSALLVPNLIGNLADWDRLRAIADRHGLLVVEDSADTLGATLNGTSTGTRADICTTSFYGSHVINCAGNGGMLCTDDPAIVDRVRLLRSWGRASSLLADAESGAARFDVELDGIPYDRKFVFEAIGYNMEPSEMGAAFGRVQLDRLEQNIRARIANFQAHYGFFQSLEEWFVLPEELGGSRTAWLAFPLLIRDTAPFTRGEFQAFLEAENIQTRTVFTGNILRQPAFREVRCRRAEAGYAEADKVMRGGVLIGCHQGLTAEQMDHVHTTVTAFVRG